MKLRTKEEYDAALMRWSELKDQYKEIYGKDWDCRSKQGNALDDEIFEYWNDLHQYDKTNGPGW